MTPTTPEGAPETGGALDPFRHSLDDVLDAFAAHEGDRYHGLRKLLPKLVQPSWHKHAHSGMYHENRHRHEQPSPAAEKAKRREQRKKTRFARALAGEHTRVSAPRAAA